MGVYEVQEHFREVVPTLNRAWEANTEVLLENASLSHWQGETAVGFCGETDCVCLGLCADLCQKDGSNHNMEETGQNCDKTIFRPHAFKG